MNNCNDYKMKKKITIFDIANELAMSRNTVSKAINGTGSVSEETKEKVIGLEGKSESHKEVGEEIHFSKPEYSLGELRFQPDLKHRIRGKGSQSASPHGHGPFLRLHQAEKQEKEEEGAHQKTQVIQN